MSYSQLWSLSEKKNFAPRDLANENPALNFITFRRFAMDSNINSSSYLAEDYDEPLIASIDGRLDEGEELEGLKNAVCIRPFSWLEYFSFFTIGMSMMWTW
jgi:hypothetical protein